MGMYTELVMGIEIKFDTEIIDILRYMLDDNFIKPQLPDHALFKTERWEYMLHSDSFYFDGITHSELVCNNLCGEKVCFLTVRTNLKNYQSEIECFLDWLSPAIKTHGFLGYKRYEECALPTLIYNDGGKIRYIQIVDQADEKCFIENS